MKTMLLVALLCAVPAFADEYHEANCPSVDRSRMTEMPRAAAEARGSMPAADCHPTERMRSLGQSWSWPPTTASANREQSENCHWVNGYIRKDGTRVRGYYRCR